MQKWNIRGGIQEFWQGKKGAKIQRGDAAPVISFPLASSAADQRTSGE
jgi:hypothetical protein